MSDEPTGTPGPSGESGIRGPDTFVDELDAFRATWRAGFKDPELSYVLGNLNGFVDHLRRAGYRLVKNDPLPCDVTLPPGTIIRKGCELSALLVGIEARRRAPLT